MEFLEIPERTSGKRTYGLTSVIDLGTPIEELRNILNDFSHIIDIAKIGIGTAYITPNFQNKVNLYKKHNIKVYCGGTFFEKCYYQNKIPEYATYLHKLGIEWIEVSSGTLDIPIEERLNLIHLLKKDFHVIAEVGSKDASKEMTISEWKEEIQLLLDAGCKYVITEGRDSGTSGIYEKNGKIKSCLISELLEDIDSQKIIFEAPTPKHQMYFINEIGPNVNLGNVKMNDVLVLEAQRCGLRCETFYLEDQICKLPL
ncbi:phosphosulfolactate synthase [Lederbergia citrea]|uniref:Phosphosulfolactate synthase n=1 Tax=Lederbergia citrea TaxID=2833581 RepID=A0A942US66_9BACI|nr:phosphosulfolactate synthase [Lederbergia citrea]MBS4176788.1 phosphosulfolactate synthase [Lederbergia citrea]MBS4203348.1 phosphosulfolactate synthase [Lederbergia citrea]MBS4221979.1 phosphosulfolactate synthase [Lederbergia citrea]